MNTADHAHAQRRCAYPVPEGDADLVRLPVLDDPHRPIDGLRAILPVVREQRGYEPRNLRGEEQRAAAGGCGLGPPLDICACKR